jgi:Icc protein
MVQETCLRIVQLTDIHLFAQTEQCLLGVPTAQSFAALVHQLQQLAPQPDLILITGDLSQDGTAASYNQVQALLSSLEIPVYWLPGNHDCVEVMERTLQHPLFLPDKAFEKNGWRFLLLNSQEPGCVHGRLTSERLAWLDRELCREVMLTIVALHHPPFAVNSTWLDTSILQNSDELFAVLDRHAHVKLVVFGHIHQEFQRQHNGVTYLGTPSTCIQFEPESSDFALDQEQPGFRVIELEADGSWASQVHRIEYTCKLDLAAAGY